MFQIRKIENSDKSKVKDIWIKNWGSDVMVTRGRSYNALEYPGLLAIEDNYIIGLLVYRIESSECEILSLDSLSENRGVGSKLLQHLIEFAESIKCTRVWLITTNDNTKAMGFYQRRGFEFRAIYLNAIDEARKIKPQIPLLGYDNIPIKHEIEMECKL